MKVFGASPETISEIIEGEEQKTDDLFEIFEENFEVVKLFMTLSTQWKTSFGGVTGLDYVAVKATMDILDSKNREALLDDLQIMEFAVLKILNKKAEA